MLHISLLVMSRLITIKSAVFISLVYSLLPRDLIYLLILRPTNNKVIWGRDLSLRFIQKTGKAGTGSCDPWIVGLADCQLHCRSPCVMKTIMKMICAS